jgi:hypothetical protein
MSLAPPGFGRRPDDQNQLAPPALEEGGKMKYVKILGLAAVAAAALMAFVGAGTASATTTGCTVTDCSSGMIGPGTGDEEIHAVLKAGTKAILTPSNELPTVECEESTVKANVETTTTPEGKIAELTFKKCNNTVEVLEPGSLVLHWDAEHNGYLTVHGFHVRVKGLFGSLSCDFGETITANEPPPGPGEPPKNALTVTGGDPAIVDATATIPLTPGGETGFIECPKSAVWHAEYEVTNPKPLYVSEGL